MCAIVCKLRKKLTAVSEGEIYIHTVWGRGYVLRDPEKSGTEFDNSKQEVAASA